MRHFRQKPSARKQAGPLAKQLILGYETARLVVHGQRQVHILPVRSSDHRKRFHEDQRLAVKGYIGGIVEAKVIVSAVHRIPLRSVDFRTARAFGATHLDGFRLGWVEANDTTRVLKWDDPEDDYHAALLERFDARWSDRDVWVVWFELDRNQPARLLAERSDELYVENAARALKDEMPALTEEEHERHIGKPSKNLAVEREKRRLMNAELLTDDERLEVAKRDAAHKGVDISRELGALNFTRNGRMLGAIEAIERKVYRVAA